MIKIVIDGKLYDVKPGKNLLETCLGLGMNIPHFCFHPALGSVGACRLCAVKKFKDENDTRGRIIMSCMEPVAEGLIISIKDPETIAFRASVIESLMTNHPHDCPVCDEGGECHLQDMTVMAGHNYRKFDFRKRTFKNQDLGPFISHEMNRCIECYRCVRFYRDYAGGTDLSVFSAHNHVYFGRHEDGILENEFSGNLVEVCPTGVFTDKTFKKHFTRKWDLTNSPSVCVHCSLGCNTIASERYGSLRRIMNRYNGAVNGYFLCDRGRFGYEFVNSENRLKIPKLKAGSKTQQENSGNILMNSSFKESLSENKRIIGIGSPRASLESNFALLSLTGRENFFHGVSGKEQYLTKKISDFLQHGSIHTPSLREAGNADAVLILGEDLINTAPMMGLAVRQAARTKPKEKAGIKGVHEWDDNALREMAQQEKSPVYIATPYANKLDDIATIAFRGTNPDIAYLGFAVASLISKKAPAPDKITRVINEPAAEIASSLLSAKRPLVVTGINNGTEDILNAAINIAEALSEEGSKPMLSFILPECNSMGLSLLPGQSVDDAVQLSQKEKIDTLIILENDLYRRVDKKAADDLFERCGNVIVIDQLVGETAQKADYLLPAATFAESQGTFVNNEGRAQRFYKAVISEKNIMAGWQWITGLTAIRKNGRQTTNTVFKDIVTRLTEEFPLLAGIKTGIPDAGFRVLNTKIPRQTIRFSGRTAINAHINVNERKPLQDPDSPLAFTMEGQSERPPSSLVPFYWTPGWNSVQAEYAYLDEPNGELKGGNPGVLLFKDRNTDHAAFFKPKIIKQKIQPGEITVVPVFRIFGSEELSSDSPSVKQRIPEPFIYFNQDDADSFGITNGDQVKLDISGTSFKVRAYSDYNIVKGLAGLPVNLPGVQYIELPAKGILNKV